jgi:hypothetical protein
VACFNDRLEYIRRSSFFPPSLRLKAPQISLSVSRPTCGHQFSPSPSSEFAGTQSSKINFHEESRGTPAPPPNMTNLIPVHEEIARARALTLVFPMVPSPSAAIATHRKKFGGTDPQLGSIKDSDISPQRHIAIKQMAVTAYCEQGDITVQYCPTDENPADHFTKPLASVKFAKHVTTIMGLASHDQFGMSRPLEPKRS